MKAKKIDFANFLFFLAWFIYIISYMLLKQTELQELINSDYLYKFFQIIVGVILIIKIIFVDKYNFKRLILYLIIGTIFFISAYFTKFEFLLFMLLFVLASRNIDFKKFVKFDFKIKICLLIFITLLGITGIFPNFTREINGTFKQALGFYHPNTLGVFIIIILLEFIYLKENKLNLKDWVLIITLIFICYFICKSRTSIYIFIFVLIINIILKRFKNIFNKRIIKFSFIVLPFIIVGFSFAIVSLYQDRHPIALKLDDILTTRIKYASKFLDEYDVSLFGEKIETVTTRESLLYNQVPKILDMGYIRVALNGGILILVILIMVQSVIQYKAIKNNNITVLICNTFFIILGFTETYGYILAFNFILLSLFNLERIRE